MAIGIPGLRFDPVRAYNFLITLVDSTSALGTLSSAVQNVILGGFTECSGLEMELETESYTEGGNNGRVLTFPTRVKWSHIRLKRGAAMSMELWDWHYSFVEGKGKRRDGIVLLQNDLHVPVQLWAFTRGLPTKWTGPSMNASQSQVAIEELEIAHEGLRSHTPGSIIGGAVRSLF
ncbi:MAG: hypothetical protein A3K13_08195 [Gemmatimonadetes bacterium RIFCSPLOWO2_12_FULL_68_9]|nr:MAG: hypothetical protein A3K13_08195 [Gemmatimonadetes bacterium RIFCSPLOWO2_12_FULL_68_9]